MAVIAAKNKVMKRRRRRRRKESWKKKEKEKKKEEKKRERSMYGWKCGIYRSESGHLGWVDSRARHWNGEVDRVQRGAPPLPVIGDLTVTVQCHALWTVET
ncbi:hypothetical protein PIB30_087305, partial [Stylosanthes scabra]|nr:hypothetical protein [Stylosanthes scabra]